VDCGAVLTTIGITAAALGTLWALNSSADENTAEYAHHEVEMCDRLGLLSPSEAQKTAVVGRTELLTAAEIGRLHTTAAAIKAEHASSVLHRSDEGIAQSGRGNWETTFLHTDGQFDARYVNIWCSVSVQAYLLLCGTTDGQNREFEKLWGSTKSHTIHLSSLCVAF
jgi:hypothetical protein